MAPGEAVGSFPLECAIDELAEQIGIDPIEFRNRNEPHKDPTMATPHECVSEHVHVRDLDVSFMVSAEYRHVAGEMNASGIALWDVFAVVPV